MKKIKIVIVGGGFGGVYTAKNLCKYFDKNKIEITLINRSNYFLFTPLLHEVATGGLTADSIREPIREVFRNCPVNIVEDTVVEMDKVNKIVKTINTSYAYDYLVVATGAETNYFNTPGAKEHTFALKNLSDASSLRNHIIQTCEQAVLTKNKDMLVTSIIGAGPTGVELAAELQEYMQHTIFTYYNTSHFKKEDIKVILVTATPDIISQFPPKMRIVAAKELNNRGIEIKANTIVVKVEPGQLSFKDGTTMKSHTIVWVAGVTAGASGRLEINESLQTTSSPEVFALGDTAGKCPMLAQVAVQQAKVVAYNIHALIEKKKLRVFIFKQKGLLISIGQWYAIGNFFGLTFRGRIMWLIWRIVYLLNFISWRKRFEIAFEWTMNLFSPRDIGRDGV